MSKYSVVTRASEYPFKVEADDIRMDDNFVYFLSGEDTVATVARDKFIYYCKLSVAKDS